MLHNCILFNAILGIPKPSSTQAYCFQQRTRPIFSGPQDFRVQLAICTRENPIPSPHFNPNPSLTFVRMKPSRDNCHAARVRTLTQHTSSRQSNANIIKLQYSYSRTTKLKDQLNELKAAIYSGITMQFKISFLTLYKRHLGSIPVHVIRRPRFLFSIFWNFRFHETWDLHTRNKCFLPTHPSRENNHAVFSLRMPKREWRGEGTWLGLEPRTFSFTVLSSSTELPGSPYKFFHLHIFNVNYYLTIVLHKWENKL